MKTRDFSPPQVGGNDIVQGRSQFTGQLFKSCGGTTPKESLKPNSHRFLASARRRDFSQTEVPDARAESIYAEDLLLFAVSLVSTADPPVGSEDYDGVGLVVTMDLGCE